MTLFPSKKAFVGVVLDRFIASGKKRSAVHYVVGLKPDETAS